MSGQTTTQKFLKEHPICCFCGGNTKATTRDHVPSRQLFTLKQRPKGFEVPACDFCNSVTSQHEQVAAMISRAYPPPKTQREEEERQKIMRAVENNSPGIILEMQPSRDQIQNMENSELPGKPANVGPLINHSIHQFGRKLTIAAHYAVTGRIVPREYGVGVRWYSNFQIFTEGLPTELTQILGQPHTLKQGSWDVGDQFFLQWALSETSGLYCAGFRRAFATLGFVNPDKDFLNDVENGEVFGVFDSRQKL